MCKCTFLSYIDHRTPSLNLFDNLLLVSGVTSSSRLNELVRYYHRTNLTQLGVTVLEPKVLTTIFT